MNKPPCIFIVDDDDAVRDGLAMVIETIGLPCQTYVNAEQFLESYKPGTPGCLILDVNMPGMHGDELQTELNKRAIDLPIIFLSAHGDIPMSVRTIKAGAVDFLTKPVEINILLNLIQAEIQNQVNKHRQLEAKRVFCQSLETLTSRESEILPFVLTGHANKEIAQKLGISYRTVELYRTRVLQKTGASNFLELGRFFELHQVPINHNNEKQ